VAFSMRPNTDDEKIRAYLEEEARASRRSGGSQLSGGAPQAPARPPAFKDNGRDMRAGSILAGAQGSNPYGAATPPPRPELPAQRPGAPTNAPPGAAMGMASRPDPYGRAAPPAGPAQFAPTPPKPAAGPGAASAAPAAAAMTGGAGAAAAPWLAVIMDYKQRQDQANATRRGAREDIQQHYAKSLGFPVYGTYAAKANRDASEAEGGGYLDQILGAFG
jgi:hypothetical protein